MFLSEWLAKWLAVRVSLLVTGLLTDWQLLNNWLSEQKPRKGIVASQQVLLSLLWSHNFTRYKAIIYDKSNLKIQILLKRIMVCEASNFLYKEASSGGQRGYITQI